MTDRRSFKLDKRHNEDKMSKNKVGSENKVGEIFLPSKWAGLTIG